MQAVSAIILAAGDNKRFVPLRDDSHKGFISMGGSTLLEHTISSLAAVNISSIKIVVKSLTASSDAERKGLEKTFPKLSISWHEQPQALGQADAIMTASKKIEDDELIVVVSPYHITAGSYLKELLAVANKHKAEAVVSVVETQTPQEYGIVTLDGSLVTSLTEKPKDAPVPSLKVHSMYVLNAKFLKRLTNHNVTHYGLEEALNEAIKEKLVRAVPAKIPLPTVKFAWDTLTVIPTVVSILKQTVKPQKYPENIFIDETDGPVVIDPTATIRQFVTITGPCYIGKNTFIGEYSSVRGSCIEADCVIGSRTEIVRSYLQEKVTIHYGYLADSVIGEKTTIGAGMLTANKRLDAKTVKVGIADSVISSGKRKLGIMVGSQSQFGVRVTSMPGTIVYPKVIIQPNSVIRHTVQE